MEIIVNAEGARVRYSTGDNHQRIEKIIVYPDTGKTVSLEVKGFNFEGPKTLFYVPRITKSEYYRFGVLGELPLLTLDFETIQISCNETPKEPQTAPELSEEKKALCRLYYVWGNQPADGPIEIEIERSCWAIVALALDELQNLREDCL